MRYSVDELDRFGSALMEEAERLELIAPPRQKRSFQSLRVQISDAYVRFHQAIGSHQATSARIQAEKLFRLADSLKKLAAPPERLKIEIRLSSI